MTRVTIHQRQYQISSYNIQLSIYIILGTDKSLYRPLLLEHILQSQEYLIEDTVPPHNHHHPKGLPH